MPKAVELEILKRADGSFICIPKETINFDGKPCQIIDQTHGWWIHERNIKGGASDGIGDEVIVRDFKPEDFDAMNGKCYVEVNHLGEMICPRNGRGNIKIVLFITKPEYDQVVPQPVQEERA